MCKFGENGIMMNDGTLLSWNVDPADIDPRYIKELIENDMWGAYHTRRATHNLREAMQSGFSNIELKIDDIAKDIKSNYLTIEVAEANESELKKYIQRMISEAPKSFLSNTAKIVKDISVIITSIGIAGSIIGVGWLFLKEFILNK